MGTKNNRLDRIVLHQTHNTLFFKLISHTVSLNVLGKIVKTNQSILI